jgi:hypothetical protein
MTAPEPPPDGEHVYCRYPECGRPLKALTSRALHLGPVCFRKLVGSTRRRVTAVHAGQLVLDLDGDLGEDPQCSAAPTERIAR